MAGTLLYMVQRITGKEEFEARRFMASYRQGEPDYEAMADALLKEDEPEELKRFSQRRLDEMHQRLMHTPHAAQYLISRGFTKQTAETFYCGYAIREDREGNKTEIVSVPVHDDTGMPVGYVGRSIYGKEFFNSGKLPRREVVFNAHRAKKAGGTAIITEASFDTMLLHQRGFPGAVALLGGYLGKNQVRVLNHNFERIILATDFDKKKFWTPCRRCEKAGHSKCVGHNAGRDFGMKIANALRGKEILWACYDTFNVYPDGKKDIGDLSDQETIMVVNNALPHYEYLSLNLY